MNKPLTRLGLVAVPVVLLLVLEISVRAIVPNVLGARGSRSEFLVNDEIAHEGEYQRDPQLFWTMVENGRVSGYVKGGVRTNAFGLRGAQVITPKPQAVHRVLGLGDSCTFGLGIADDEQVWGAVFARAIAPDLAPRRVEWVNGGVSGYSSLQGKRLLERIGAQIAPDLVTICFGLNDYLYAAGAADRELELPPVSLLKLRDALRRSALVRWLEQRLAPGDPPAVSHVRRIPERRVAADELRVNLTDLVRASRALGAQVLLLTVAVRPTVPLVLNPVYLPEADGYRRVFGVWLAGRAAHRLAEWPGSEADLQREASANPELPLPHFLLGRLWCRRGDPRAERELARARELDRDRAVVAEYNAVIAAVARAEHVMLFDQAALFAAPESENLFDDERHLNADGHRLLGEALARVWREAR